MWTLLLACAETPVEAALPTSCTSGATAVGIVSALTFARPEGTVSNGFDLDDQVTSAGGSTGCGVADYTSPGGLRGVDNGFGLLVPALEMTEAAAVEGLVQDSINSGELLIAFELTGVDDPQDDSCVGFTIGRASGSPLLGTDGSLEPYQTMERDPSVVPYSVGDLQLVDGYLEARPVVVDLPISVLNVDLVFHIDGAVFGVQVQPDGGFRGTFAGGVDRQTLVDIGYSEGVDAALGPLLEGFLDYSSDLDADGDAYCEQIAITFDFTAIPAFLFDE